MDLLTKYSQLIDEMESNQYHYQGQIFNDRSDRIVVIMGRRSGKSQVVVQRALKLTGRILIATHNSMLASIMFDKIKAAIPERLLSVSRSSSKEIETTYGATVHIVSNTGSLLGRTYDHIMIDEPSYMDEDTISDIFASGMNATKLLIGTPLGMPDTLYDYYYDPRWSRYRINWEDTV